MRSSEEKLFSKLSFESHASVPSTLGLHYGSTYIQVKLDLRGDLPPINANFPPKIL